MKNATIMMILLLAPLAAALPPPPTTAWVVSSDTTIEGIPFVFAQDVIVMPGATLTLRAADAVVARPLNISVRGALVLDEGARLAGAAGPFDLYVAPGGALRIEDAGLVAARAVVAGEALLDRASVASGAFVVLGDAEVHRSAFDAAIGPAAMVRAGGALLLANATVGQTGDYGIRIEGGSARIENATFALSPSYSVYAAGGAVDLVDSTFSAHCGAFLTGGAAGTLARNVFATLDHGVSLISAGAVDVDGNVFDGTADALLVYGGSTGVSRNVFTGNAIGVGTLFGSSSAPTLRNNTFEGNDVAVKNEIAASLDARWNWWGSSAGPAAGDVSGSVVASPWLTTAP